MTNTTKLQLIRIALNVLALVWLVLPLVMLVDGFAFVIGVSTIIEWSTARLVVAVIWTAIVGVCFFGAAKIVTDFEREEQERLTAEKASKA